MRGKKETIKLDAALVGVLQPAVFVAELRNGHRLVAVWGGPEAGTPRCGARVEVETSPADMARGRIVSVRMRGE